MEFVEYSLECVAVGQLLLVHSRVDVKDVKDLTDAIIKAISPLASQGQTQEPILQTEYCSTGARFAVPASVFRRIIADFEDVVSVCIDERKVAA